MKKLRIGMMLLPLFISVKGIGQEGIDETLLKWNKESVPYISVGQLASDQEVLLLDTRKREEFLVSHLQNAVWVGYKEFNMDSLLRRVPDRNTAIVVYCSVGVRSETIGEKLQKRAYTNVKNLYGGIFEWKNQGNPVFDMEGKETENVHAFSKRWGRLLTAGVKIYDPDMTDRDGSN